MKTVRQQVLDYIRTRRVVTANELSQAMQMTPANARHHLNILVEEGLVQVVGKMPAQGRGRPVIRYGLRDQTGGQDLRSLCSVVLDELLSGVAECNDEELMDRLAHRLADHLKAIKGSSVEQSAVSQAHLHLSQRLLQAVNLLNQLNYAARWEAHAQAPRIILGQCPYRAIIDRYPQLCQMDQALLSRMTASGALQTARLVPDGRGLEHCIFVLGGREGKS